MPQIANQDYFNLGNVLGGDRTSYNVMGHYLRGTLLDCFFDADGDTKGVFRVLSYYVDDENTIQIKYAGTVTEVSTYSVTVLPLDTYRVLSSIQEQVGSYILLSDENNYLLANKAHVCVDGYGIIITTTEDDVIASCTKGEPITTGQIVNIAEEDMQYLVGASLY